MSRSFYQTVVISTAMIFCFRTHNKPLNLNNIIEEKEHNEEDPVPDEIIRFLVTKVWYLTHCYLLGSQLGALAEVSSSDSDEDGNVSQAELEFYAYAER